MPRTSAMSSSHRSVSSEHVPHQYINLEYCMNALSRREDIATAIQLTNNKHAAFIEILFLNHLFQTIQQTKCQLEQESNKLETESPDFFQKKPLTDYMLG
jgi:hypothetical protein